MEFIKEFISKLLNEYLYITLTSIIALIIIIFVLILIYVNKKRARQEKSTAKFKQESLQFLTPEEIDNISNNSANPEEVKEHLNAEVQEVKSKAKKSKSTKSKNKKPSDKVKFVQPKQEVVEQTPTPSVDEQPKQVKNKTKKTATPKVEAKKTETKTTSTQPKNKAPKSEQKPQATQPQTEEIKKQPKTTKTLKTVPPTTQPKKDEVKSSPIKSDAKQVKEEAKVETKRQYAGKWKISQDDDGYYATLTASNGGSLLVTEKYKSLSSVKNGIETIKKNVDGGNFAISVDKYGHYRFKLFNLSNRLICVSEDYSSKNKCESGIESVKRFAKTNIVIMEENK